MGFRNEKGINRPIAAGAARPVWSLFCRVVDNFGDIGVCWRLARTLSLHHHVAVHLWLDVPAAMHDLCPPSRDRTLPFELDGVRVHHWQDYIAGDDGEVVIEAFACELPAACVAAMAQAPRPPLWINLEYLTAESWIGDFHCQRSPHPRLPLLKHFFFPGFTAASGGLLREPDLFAQRDAWRADTLAQRRFLARLGGGGEPGTRRISLFAYPQAQLGALLDCWAYGNEPVLVFVPDGRVTVDIAAYFGVAEVAVGSVLRRGVLEVRRVPFLSQDDYDRLLWVCDLNFVRGEDSFVRAQWAARPFVWHIYPQDEDAHRIKLDAFIARFSSVVPPAAGQAFATMLRAWNGFGDVAEAWRAWTAQREALEKAAQQWAATLAQQPDLAAALVKFSQTRVK